MVVPPYLILLAHNQISYSYSTKYNHIDPKIVLLTLFKEKDLLHKCNKSAIHVVPVSLYYSIIIRGNTRDGRGNNCGGGSGGCCCA
jgi:hypothetical protein